MLGTWIIVADSARARFFLMESRNLPLTELDNIVHTEGRMLQGSVVSDREGKLAGHGNSGYSFEPPTDFKQHELEIFVKRIAEKLEQARVNDSYQKLILIAPPALLGKLRQALNPHILEMISHSIDKNCVSENADEILERIIRST